MRACVRACVRLKGPAAQEALKQSQRPQRLVLRHHMARFLDGDEGKVARQLGGRVGHGGRAIPALPGACLATFGRQVYVHCSRNICVLGCTESCLQKVASCADGRRDVTGGNLLDHPGAEALHLQPAI